MKMTFLLESKKSTLEYYFIYPHVKREIGNCLFWFLKTIGCAVNAKKDTK
jgi:hypothetical protein